MFSNDGFWSGQSENQGPNQTHLFTTFPDSALDLEDEHTAEMKFHPSKIEQTSLPLPVIDPTAKNDERLHIWQMEYYQEYFQVDSKQVFERLLGSITPRPNQSYFNSTIRQNPDLYGPFWVCVTFIITVAISGNIVTYFHVPNSEFQIDFSKITLSAIVSKQI